MGKKESGLLEKRSILHNKKADEKYYIIISLILGILVIGLALYFIFQEYFTQEDINWESCRQSIVLRAISPEWGGATTKDLSPLKCQTQVININFKNTTRAEQVFADNLVQCWYLVGEGKYKIFPSEVFDHESHCLSCARIHLDTSVQSYYADPNNNISFRRAVQSKMPKSDLTYAQYLTPSFNEQAIKPDAFKFSGWDDSGFKVNPNPSFFEAGSLFSYPSYWDVNKGDLQIVVSSLVFNNGKYIEYPLFLQQQDFVQLDSVAFGSTLENAVVYFATLGISPIKELITGDPLVKSDMKVCNKWEGIPA